MKFKVTVKELHTRDYFIEGESETDALLKLAINNSAAAFIADDLQVSSKILNASADEWDQVCNKGRQAFARNQTLSRQQPSTLAEFIGHLGEQAAHEKSAKEAMQHIAIQPPDVALQGVIG